MSSTGLPLDGWLGPRAVLPWRSNRQTVPPWSPLIQWSTYRLPLAQVLRANGWPCGATLPGTGSISDNRLKVQKWVALTHSDIDNVAEMLRMCLEASGAMAPMRLNMHKHKKYSGVVNYKHDGAVTRAPYQSVAVH